jgi:hypothetical protein
MRLASLAAAGAAAAVLGLGACGGSEGSDPSPEPSPGRWLGAETIDGGAPAGTSGTNALEPRAGMDDDGGAVAAFLSDDAIWAARATAAGGWSVATRLGGRPAGAPSNWLWEPTLAVNANGAAVVAWATQQSASAGRLLFACRLAPPGAAWSTAERIDGGQAAALFLPYEASLALDDNGNGLAAWDSDGLVSTRLLALAGWRAPERQAARPSAAPRVFLDSRGNGFATWSEAGEAFARRFEADRGWTDTARFAPAAGASFVGAGELALDDASGEALIVWQHSEGLLQTPSVWAASWSGARWTSMAQISGSRGGASPRVGIDDEGVGIAAWIEPQSGPAAARWERGRWATPRLVASAPGAGPVALAVSGAGTAVLAWRESDAPTGRARVRASWYDGSVWQSPETLQSSSNQPNDPAVAGDSCGRAVAVWSEYESGRSRIVANRYDTACP